MPILVSLSGLPGAGKTTIARLVVPQLQAVYLRVDIIEQAFRDEGMTTDQIGGLGYVVGYRLATENLTLGMNVVADTVNPWPLTRDAWRSSAIAAGSPCLEVEITCSDAVEHRRRVEERAGNVAGMPLPTWVQVLERDYRPWDRTPLRLDTSILSPEQAVAEILAALPSVLNS
jgi:predicted kinase